VGPGVALRLPADANPSDQDALVASIACPGSKGKNRCAAVGYYDDAVGMQAFIAEGSGTRWGRASAYFTKSGAGDALAVFYEGGRWRRPAGVTALPANASGSDPGASLDGVSCGALTCLAVGDYKDRQGAQGVMAVSEAGGRWGARRSDCPRTRPREARSRRPCSA
jgi:hypothetical protein